MKGLRVFDHFIRLVSMQGVPPNPPREVRRGGLTPSYGAEDTGCKITIRFDSGDNSPRCETHTEVINNWRPDVGGKQKEFWECLKRFCVVQRLLVSNTIMAKGIRLYH